MVTHSLGSLLSAASGEQVGSSRVSEYWRTRRLQVVRFALVAGIGYYAGTRVGFAFTPVGQPNSAFWPPNAILLALLLLAPRNVWWALLAAVVPAHLLAQLQSGVPIWTALAWLATNTSEALIGAFCIGKLVRPTRVFDSVRGVFILVLFGVLIAPFATSFLDAAGVVLTGWGHGYLSISAQRFWTNALAELTIVPVIVLCGSQWTSWLKSATLGRICEATLLILATVLAALFVFGFEPILPTTTPELLFLPLVLLMWATARFGSGGLSVCLLMISITAIWFVVHGHAPFPSASLADNVLALQILLCTVVLPLMFVSAFMTESRRAQASLRQLGADLINAQEQERSRIGRELHDDINQKLAMLSLDLQQIQEDSDAQYRLEGARNQLSAISNDVQALSHELHSSTLEYLGVVPGIRSWCREFSERNRIETDFREAVTSTVPFELGVCLFRVLQEGLHNVVKHSGADRVEVELLEKSGVIYLTIKDAGKGFDMEALKQAKGLGLTSMRERVRLVNGVITIDSVPKRGTTIRVRVPLGSQEARAIA